MQGDENLNSFLTKKLYNGNKQIFSQNIFYISSQVEILWSNKILNNFK